MLVGMDCLTDNRDSRTWTDSTGKFSVEAELISFDGGQVVLRTAAGKEIKIALDRLCKEDQLFATKGPVAESPMLNDVSIETTSDSKSKSKGSAKLLPATEATALKELADRFYDDLTTKDRMIARAALTDEAQTLVDEDKSPLAHLPSPDKRSDAVRVGKPKISSGQAIVPVLVKIDGSVQNTSLHLRKVGEEWRVFAISAKIGSEENTINFEAVIASKKKAESPLDKLQNQPISIAGLTLAGKPVSLEDYKGKVVLIDFWATWCGPCRAEIPNILANYQKYHSAGFEVIAISVDKDLDDLFTFVKEENPPWVVLADKHPNNNNSMARKFGISGIPAFILVGADSKVLDVNCRGQRLGQRLAEIFDK